MIVELQITDLWRNTIIFKQNASGDLIKGREGFPSGLELRELKYLLGGDPVWVEELTINKLKLPDKKTCQKKLKTFANLNLSAIFVIYLQNKPLNDPRNSFE